MKISQLIVLSFLLLLFAGGCDKSEDVPYDHPFVYIMHEGATSTTVSARANTIGEYYVYLSSKPLSENLELEYEILNGDGLVEGEDFELITTGNKLTFLPGIYKLPIRIRWLPKDVNPDQDNSITINLLGNNLGVTTGYPGPDNLKTSLTITKVL
jgi:hypothetical protein